uniref:Fibronectin type-III domain-containing protein n=1 Tax=Mesocestoides corti TaxID=53468 RepID=A0A5K3FZJ3_MESCO
ALIVLKATLILGGHVEYRAAPSPPTDITAKALSSSSIMVSWSPPAQTNGPLEPYRAHCTKVGENWPRSAT